MDSGLLRVLVQQQIISEDKARSLIEKSAAESKPAVVFLLQEKIITAQQLAQLMAKLFSCPLFDLTYFNKDKLDFSALTEEMSIKFHAVPLLKRGRRLTVGVIDPSVLPLLQKATFSSGVSIDLVIVQADHLLALLESIGASSTNILDDFDTDLIGGSAVVAIADEEQVEDGPIAKFVHKILLDALKAGASDIHFEFYEKVARVRFRVDGQLREVVNPPTQIREQIASRIKVM